ncbi:MAG TPA: hypothetical protein VEB18_02920 [Candidatus Paceibacterota bacterium]|nr:hypothetical protein [Candidatus Paceibacterota bacterium]
MTFHSSETVHGYAIHANASVGLYPEMDGELIETLRTAFGHDPRVATMLQVRSADGCVPIVSQSFGAILASYDQLTTCQKHAVAELAHFERIVWQ